MIFNSLAFLVFFALLVPAYFFCPSKYRWLLLLIVSCYFYMAFVPVYILILFYLILVDFFMAKQIEKAQGRKRKIYLIISIVANLGTLFFFKYFNFFNQNVLAIANVLHWNYTIGFLKILLPLGLSFHTFQSLSYIIEVYRGKFQAERHLGIYALYVMFFPQLVAGPIERPQNLLPQLHNPPGYNPERVISGLQLMAWGFFKKIVIADRLAVIVDHVYSTIPSQTGIGILLAIIFFAFQLYADFSGYSDIAIGGARVLGFDLTRNFNAPYFSKSVSEFWRRWHISLSSWLRDYLYYPLAFSTKKTTRAWLYVCLFITFLASGIWHGAGWTFVVMGALYGFYLVMGLITKPFRDWLNKKCGLDNYKTVHHIFQILFTFALVCVAWVFFRAQSLNQAIAFFSHLFQGWNMSLSQFYYNYIRMPYNTLGVSKIELFFSISGILLLLFIEWLGQKLPIGTWIIKRPLFVKTVIYASLILAIIVLGVYTNKEFIYFQF